MCCFLFHQIKPTGATSEGRFRREEQSSRKRKQPMTTESDIATSPAISNPGLGGDNSAKKVGHVSIRKNASVFRSLVNLLSRILNIFHVSVSSKAHNNCQRKVGVRLPDSTSIYVHLLKRAMSFSVHDMSHLSLMSVFLRLHRRPLGTRACELSVSVFEPIVCVGSVIVTFCQA